jgi:hypothetical protein
MCVYQPVVDIVNGDFYPTNGSTCTFTIQDNHGGSSPAITSTATTVTPIIESVRRSH